MTTRAGRWLYVIRLDPAVAREARFQEQNPDAKAVQDYLYVGQTGHDPETRFSQHLEGYKACRLVKKYGIELLLVRCLQLDREASPMATELEREYAEHLRSEGYGVYQN